MSNLERNKFHTIRKNLNNINYFNMLPIDGLFLCLRLTVGIHPPGGAEVPWAKPERRNRQWSDPYVKHHICGRSYIIYTSYWSHLRPQSGTGHIDLSSAGLTNKHV